jgi:hypothetical protein
MTKIKMDFQDYSISKPSAEWFENSCRMWADHYSFLLGLSFITKEEEVWYRENLQMNKIYDC